MISNREAHTSDFFVRVTKKLLSYPRQSFSCTDDCPAAPRIQGPSREFIVRPQVTLNRPYSKCGLRTQNIFQPGVKFLRVAIEADRDKDDTSTCRTAVKHYPYRVMRVKWSKMKVWVRKIRSYCVFLVSFASSYQIGRTATWMKGAEEQQREGGW